MVNPQIIFIVGPTAIGKTAVALELASKIPSEIVSCDSMQVYREISIASSKPSATERKKIPHHLLDVISVEESFDVAAFNKLAIEAIETILKKKKSALVVGGSGLYMQVLLDGIFSAKRHGGKGGRDVVLRQELIERAEKEGTEKLYQELLRVDPVAAAKIHANDGRRIIRALEVFKSTRTPISKLQKNRSGLWGKKPIHIFCLTRQREELYELINQRVEKMFRDGLVKEIKALSNKNLSLTGQRIIGVREVQGYLKGEYGLEQAKELLKMNTRRFAKRQLTWFRKDKRLNWLTIDKEHNVSNIVRTILNELGKT